MIEVEEMDISEIDEDLIPAHRCKKCGTVCCRGEYFEEDCVFCV